MTKAALMPGLPLIYPRTMNKLTISMVTASAISLLLIFASATPSHAADPKQKDAIPEKGAAAATAKSYKDVNADEFDKLRSNTNAVILDVRTPEEFASGHIPGAKNIDINSLDFEKKVGHLDKSKTYLVNCASGGRSARACGKLSKLEFSNCYNLQGGIRAWEKAGKPVDR